MTEMMRTACDGRQNGVGQRVHDEVLRACGEGFGAVSGVAILFADLVGEAGADADEALEHCQPVHAVL